MFNQEAVRVFDKNNYAAGVTIYNVHMVSRPPGISPQQDFH